MDAIPPTNPASGSTHAREDAVEHWSGPPPLSQIPAGTTESPSRGPQGGKQRRRILHGCIEAAIAEGTGNARAGRLASNMRVRAQTPWQGGRDALKGANKSKNEKKEKAFHPRLARNIHASLLLFSASVPQAARRNSWERRNTRHSLRRDGTLIVPPPIRRGSIRPVANKIAPLDKGWRHVACFSCQLLFAKQTRIVTSVTTGAVKARDQCVIHIDMARTIVTNGLRSAAIARDQCMYIKATKVNAWPNHRLSIIIRTTLL